MQIDHLPVEIYETNEVMGVAAAQAARRCILDAIDQKGQANIILATGNSQLTFFKALRAFEDMDWSRVFVFHMDEFLGIDPGHPASFPKFLRTHFLDYVDCGAFFPISGDTSRIQATCDEYTELLKKYPIDMVALGYGENGHIAFNDPPYALFDDPAWVKVVKLDEVSRQQQYKEGLFKSLEETPSQAITLTIPALLAAKQMLCIVPESRKAEAVRACLREPIDESRPGSILRRVNHARLFLDMDSAQRL